MKSWAITAICSISLILIPTSVLAGNDINPKKCTYGDKPLYGKVQIVDSFPDLKIQVVTAFPDLKVKPVTSFPDDCGEWEFVESFPDLKVQFVNSFPDLKIQFVEAFPGIP